MADEEFTVLTPIDRETLRDVLACGSIKQVAKKQHQSEDSIRYKVNKAIDALTRQMKVWQEPHQKLSEQGKRIQELEKALVNDKKNQELVKKLSNIIDSQAHKFIMLESENLRLKEEIACLKSEWPPVDSQITNNYVKADEKTTHMLGLFLKEIKIPSRIADKLKSYEIETVYDLVRYSEEQLLHLRIISNSDLLRIKKKLKKTGLTLGTDVRWVEAAQEYYIRKKLTGDGPASRPL